MTVYGRYVDEVSGRSIQVVSDLERLKGDLEVLFPQDARMAGELITAAGAMQKARAGTMSFGKPLELRGRLDGPAVMWALRKVGRYFTGTYSRPICEYARTTNDPFLRQLLNYLFLPEVPVWFVTMLLGLLADHQLGLLTEGALNFARSIEKRYRDLGGEVVYGTAVEKILTDRGQAVGVRLADGSRHKADIVVSAADGYSTIFEMLEGRYLDRQIEHKYTNWPLIRPWLMINFGVQQEFLNEPPHTTLFLADPFLINGRKVDVLSLRIFNYGQGFSPPGQTLLQVAFDTEWDYWNTLQQEDRSCYDAEKQRVAVEVLRRLEHHYPGITARVDMTDVATPYTTWRYTRNRQGAYMGWLMTPEAITKPTRMTLPGLHNFYMAGQWVAGGGVPTCLFSGRHVAQILCRRDGQRFVTDSV